MANSKQMRIVLIGSTGSGKSSLGNTLLGEDHFHESAAAKSVTSKCEIGESNVGTRKIKVADTPGIINADGKNMASIMEEFFEFLSPGPHAIIIVLAPNRESNLERRALSGLREFFRDDNFLNFTMLVMVRKKDIIGEFGESVFEEIDKMDGFYSHHCYQLLNASKAKDDKIKSLEQTIKETHEEKIRNQNRWYCSIL